MGYYTTYSLTWKYDESLGNLDEAIVEYFSKLPDWRDGGYENYKDNILIEDAKWYDQEDDMFVLSRAFPEVLFCLWGSGDNCEDLWEEYWQNGRFQLCLAEIPPYDPQKMTEYHPDTT